MKLFGKDLGHEIAIIAEVGVNHEGSVDAAADLVRSMAKAGADAVKFQSYTPSRFIAATDPDRFARVSRFGLDESDHRHLAAVAKDCGIHFFSSAISEDWIPLIAELSDAIKIASGDLTFEPVIRAAARTGKPVLLSTGNGDVAEIDQAVQWVRAEIGDRPLDQHLAILHCISAYPTPMEQANLRAIPFLTDRYGLATGWSNHVIGPQACLTAVALGAQLLEIHVTDNKSGRDFRDHEMSFEPQEIADLVAAVARTKASLGAHDKTPMPCEIASREANRKGLVAARDLAAGTILGADDLLFARPGTEIAAHEKPQVIGQPLAEAVAGGHLIPRRAIASLGD